WSYTLCATTFAVVHTVHKRCRLWLTCAAMPRFSLLVVLVALSVSSSLVGCGSCNDENRGRLPDAPPPPPDVPPDMPLPPPPVTLTITRNRAAVADVR